MVKFIFMIPVKLLDGVKRVAFNRDRSVAYIIREAISEYLKEK